MQSRAVIVGASLAGLRAAEALRRGGHDGPLTIIGAETHRPYDRPPLSKQILTGKADPSDITLPVQEGFEAEWLLGVTAVGLDLDRMRVRLGSGPDAGHKGAGHQGAGHQGAGHKGAGESGDAGESRGDGHRDTDDIPFDRLVIATGAHPRILRGVEPGPGVHYLRTIEDSVALRNGLASASQAVVIGAGFIGLEVAASARQLGLEVTVLEALPIPLERAIGPELGTAIGAMHGRKGVDIRLGIGVEGLVGTSRGVEGVRLAGGEVVPADLVVVGVGVAPTTGWLEGSGVDLADGVICDERLRVLVGGRPRPDIVAVGDVARWTHAGYGESVRIEHWTNAADQGDAAARTLLEGDEAPVYTPTPYFWSDQHGVKIQFVGETRPGDVMIVLDGDPAEDRFVAAFGRNGRLVAALGMRRPARVMALQRLIAAGAPFPPPAE